VAKSKVFDPAKASPRELGAALEEYRVTKGLSYPKLTRAITKVADTDLSDKTVMRVCTLAGEMEFNETITLAPIRKFLATELATQS
jgi:acyl-coenzyme A synthetase/AMP-(fatty) acid ligase